MRGVQALATTVAILTLASPRRTFGGRSAGLRIVTATAKPSRGLISAGGTGRISRADVIVGSASIANAVRPLAGEAGTPDGLARPSIHGRSLPRGQMGTADGPDWSLPGRRLVTIPASREFRPCGCCAACRCRNACAATGRTGSALEAASRRLGSARAGCVPLFCLPPPHLLPSDNCT